MSTASETYPPVIGIDPAPSSDSWICDPQIVLQRDRNDQPQQPIYSLRPDELYKKISALKAGGQKVLVCWDAPLTAKREPFANTFYDRDLSSRDIEIYFGKSKAAGRRGTSPPKGISVNSYGGASHWTISQYCLGLPQVGGAMGNSDSKWPLLTSDDDRRTFDGAAVVEVHPAVAAWWWVKGIRDSNTCSFVYKGSRNTEDRELKDYSPDLFWNDLVKVLGYNLPQDLTFLGAEIGNSSDKFDAAVSYLLGYLWLRKQGSISILGDRTAGAWLMPGSSEDFAAWKDYRTTCYPPKE